MWALPMDSVNDPGSMVDDCLTNSNIPMDSDLWTVTYGQWPLALIPIVWMIFV